MGPGPHTRVPFFQGSCTLGAQQAAAPPLLQRGRALRRPFCPPCESPQVARGSLAAGISGGYLFVYGGGKPKEQYSVVEWCVAPPLRLPWGPVRPAPSGCALSVWALLHLAAGAFHSSPPPASAPLCRYDPQSNRWLPGPSLQRKRFALGGAALGGAVYAVGGFDGASYLTCAERLDPRTDRWGPGGGDARLVLERCACLPLCARLPAPSFSVLPPV